MFKSLIHNNREFSKVKKFKYLSTSIRGSAAQVIEAIQVSDENYMIAWKLLQERYDDQRSIKKKHIQCLFVIPKTQKESSDSLRELIDYAKKHTRILQSIGPPVESWDALLVHMIESKLDNITRRAWEQHCESENASEQTFDGIIDFLEKNVKCLKDCSQVFKKRLFQNQIIQIIMVKFKEIDIQVDLAKIARQSLWFKRRNVIYVKEIIICTIAKSFYPCQLKIE